MDFDAFRLAASTADLADEPAAREHADLLEYRMDLAAASDLAERRTAEGEPPRDTAASAPISALHEYDGELPVLATNRAEWEGGDADGHDRLDALAAVAELPAVAAVDVELRSISHGDGERVLEHAAAHDVATVASYHDFEATPDRETMRELLSVATAHADVGKLAVTAESPEDVLDLLSVTREFTRDGETVATMAMGEAGRHSRAVAPLYGSRIGYAPVDPEDATAPGQYDLATLRRLVDDLQSEE